MSFLNDRKRAGNATPIKDTAKRRFDKNYGRVVYEYNDGVYDTKGNRLDTPQQRKKKAKQRYDKDYGGIVYDYEGEVYDTKGKPLKNTRNNRQVAPGLLRDYTPEEIREELSTKFLTQRPVTTQVSAENEEPEGKNGKSKEELQPHNIMDMTGAFTYDAAGKVLNPVYGAGSIYDSFTEINDRLSRGDFSLTPTERVKKDLNAGLKTYRELGRSYTDSVYKLARGLSKVHLPFLQNSENPLLDYVSGYLQIVSALGELKDAPFTLADTSLRNTGNTGTYAADVMNSPSALIQYFIDSYYRQFLGGIPTEGLGKDSYDAISQAYQYMLPKLNKKYVTKPLLDKSAEIDAGTKLNAYKESAIEDMIQKYYEEGRWDKAVELENLDREKITPEGIRHRENEQQRILNNRTPGRNKHSRYKKRKKR
jgi:hypothetical protein